MLNLEVFVEVCEAVSSIGVSNIADYVAYHLESVGAGVDYIANKAMEIIASCLNPIGIEPTFCLPHAGVLK